MMSLKMSGIYEIGILYMNDFNQKVLNKILKEAGLESYEIIDLPGICISMEKIIRWQIKM